MQIFGFGIIPPMTTPREFRPEMPSRRSEWVNWLLAGLALAAWLILRTQTDRVAGWHFLFVAAILLVAASTSLSNWMERSTLLTIKPEGVGFKNGLRDVSLAWDDLQEMRIVSTRFGKQVFVAGYIVETAPSRNSNFTFRTLAVNERKGQIRTKMGFAAGDFIIEQILQHSGLQPAEKTEVSRDYARP